MAPTDHRGWAIGRVDVRIPEIAELLDRATAISDQTSRASRARQIGGQVVQVRSPAALASHLAPFWYALVAVCVLSNSSGATPVVQEGDCPCSASSKASGQAPMRV
jgi:hypothetical protein